MRISILSLAIFGLFWVLTSCAPFEPYQMDMTEEIRNAKTPMQSNAEEHKKMLAEYEAQRQYYGKRGLDMESMCRALIYVYEQATKQNMDLAKSHRIMAEAIK